MVTPAAAAHVRIACRIAFTDLVAVLRPLFVQTATVASARLTRASRERTVARAFVSATVNSCRKLSTQVLTAAAELRKFKGHCRIAVGPRSTNCFLNETSSSVNVRIRLWWSGWLSAMQLSNAAPPEGKRQSLMCIFKWYFKMKVNFQIEGLITWRYQ